MVKCSACGTDNRDTARFCSRCGFPLSGMNPAGLQPGRVIGGRYRIIRPLSKGGMGATHLAIQPLAGVERKCVIKEMLDYFDVNDPTEVTKAKQRFQAEAATLTVLAHPGIPKIYDYFSEGDHNYIVMEYVEGKDLRKGLTHTDDQGGLVPGQPYPAEEVVRWGVQACKVLEYLAQIKPNPVVHHDIKPANLVLDKNAGEVRLVDFGTAKARLVAQAGSRVGLQRTSIYGTAGYAPPEQYQGQSSPKSDVYALAATMYHLLTDDDPGDHLFSFPKIAQVDPLLAPALSKALEQDPQKRSSAAQLRQDLEKWLRVPRKVKATPPVGSYRVLLPAVPDGAVVATAQALVRVLKVSERQATIWAYAAPQVVLKTTSQSEASQAVTQLKAAGVAVRTIPVDEGRSPALPAQQRNALVAKGEVPYLAMSRLGSDKRCHCYVCGHDWVSVKAVGELPPQHCPKCKAPNWSLHRLFKCSVCGHEFTHGDQRKPAKQLFAACPACGANDWLPAQAPVLSLKEQRLNVGTVRLGQGASLVLDVSNAGGGTLRGVIRCRELWWPFEQPFTGSGKVTLSLDTRQLVGEQTYRSVIDVVSSGGAAEVQVELYVQTPEKVTVSPAELDYGTIGAQPPSPQTVQVTNIGGGTLQGTVAASAPWIQVSSTAIAGNALDLSVSLKPDEMPPGQALAGTVQLATNGGHVTIPVQARALPAAIALSTPSLDFGAVPLRKTRHLAVRVTNGGAGRLEGQIASAPDWVRVDKTRWSGNVLDLAVEVDGRTLADGVERIGVIHLASNGGDVDLAVRAVALGPTLAVEPPSLDLGAMPSGSRARHRLRLTNLGTGALSGSTRSTAPWLRLKPEQFSGSAASLEAAIATQGLAPGTYAGTIDIESNGGSAQVRVQVQVVHTNRLARVLGRGLLVTGLLGVLVLVTAWIWRVARPPAAPATVTAAATPFLLQSDAAPTPLLLQLTAAPTAHIVPTSEPTSIPVVIGVSTAETATLTPMPVVSTPTPLLTAQPTWTPTNLPNPTATLVPLCPNPGVRITSPLSGATLQGTIQVQGTATIDHFSYYKFEFRMDKVQIWSFLTRFSQPVTEGVLMAWDTTAMPPGTYRLRLVVVDETGNYPEPCEISVIVKR